MKTRFYTLCEAAFKLGIAGFLVAFVCAWLPVIMHVFLKVSYDVGLFKVLSVLGVLAFFLFFVSSLLLWAEGFLGALRSIKTGSVTTGILLILFLFLCLFFAGFILHGIKKVRIAKTLGAAKST